MDLQGKRSLQPTLPLPLYHHTLQRLDDDHRRDHVKTYPREERQSNEIGHD